MSIRGIYNEDGEPLGTEYHYGDEYDQDDWYERDDYTFAETAGAHPGCCKRGDWDGVSFHRQPTVVKVMTFLGHWNAPCPPEYLWECVYCGTIGTKSELLTGDE